MIKAHCLNMYEFSPCIYYQICDAGGESATWLPLGRRVELSQMSLKHPPNNHQVLLKTQATDQTPTEH